MKVKIINQSTNPLPGYQTEHSAGMDIYANPDDRVILKPLDRALIPTGIFLELPVGTEAQIRPRSGLALKKGLTLLNSPGTIDADYRGELKVIMVNLSAEVQEINKGERIAQMVINKYEKVEWLEVSVLTETHRGKGGFGHTGN